MEPICKMNNEKILHNLQDKYVKCYQKGEKEKTKAYLDIYERINNNEYDIDENPK